MRSVRLILVLLATLGFPGGLLRAQQSSELQTIEVPEPTTLTVQIEREGVPVSEQPFVLVVDPDTQLPELPLVMVPEPTTLTIQIEREGVPVSEQPFVLVVDPDTQLPELPLVMVPEPTTLTIQIEREGVPVSEQPFVLVVDPDTQLPELPLVKVPEPTTLTVQIERLTGDDGTGPDATADVIPHELNSGPSANPGQSPVLEIPEPSVVEVILRRIEPQLSDLPPLPEAVDLTATVSKPAVESVLLPEAVDLTATVSKPAVDSVPLPEAVNLTATVSKPAVDSVPLPEAVDLTATVSKPAVDSVLLPEAVDLTATVSKPAVDSVPLPDAVNLTATVSKPAVDSVPLPEAVDLTATVTKPAVDSVPLPETVDLTATVSKPELPQSDVSGPLQLELVSIQLDSVDTIRGFNPMDDQEVAQIEDNTGFANNNDDGNNNGGGDLDLNALVPGGTLVLDTDGLADGNFSFSVFCLAPGNNINIVVGANGASLFGVARNNIGGATLEPTGRFTTFNGDNADRVFEFADNVATVATVTDVRGAGALLANVTVAANSTGFILLANCQ